MPSLLIDQPVADQVVLANQPIEVSGSATDQSPMSVNLVTVQIDAGPPVKAQLMPSSPFRNRTIVDFSATILPSGIGRHVITVTATGTRGFKATQTVIISANIVVFPPCYPEQNAATNLSSGANQSFTNWPQNIQFNAPEYYTPKTLSELAYAVLQAEALGHHVRAFGSSWSFSDVLCATDSSTVPPTLIPQQPGAMIATSQLQASLQQELQQVLAPGVDATFLIHVQAGITITALNSLLDNLPVRQTLNSGGGSGQTLAGVISTSTHGGDSLVPPLADFVCAIHMVGAGGIEHWIEPDQGITDPAKLRVVYPCLASNGSIHYDTQLFRAALVAAGSMGVIYSMVLKTVPQFGLVQHRAVTTWEALQGPDPSLTSVLDGSFLSSAYGLVNLLDGTPLPASLGPFAGNRFSQIVINPYALESNDATLNGTPLKLYVGQHLCFVTNRVPVPIPIGASNPGGGDISSLDVTKVGQAARDSLGSNVLDYDIRFLNFLNSLTPNEDLSTKAALLVDFLAQNFDERTISAVITYVLRQIMPVGERLDVSYKLSDVLSWGAAIRSLSVEAMFSVPDAVAFVPQVFALVESYAARSPKNYIAGYLSLRFVGQKTTALLGTQRWSPTCCVEYAMLSGSDGAAEFVNDLQKLALGSHGALHWGQCNEVMTAVDVQNIYGFDTIEAFRQARGILSKNATLATFDNSFTDRLGLSAEGSIIIEELDLVGVTSDGNIWHTIRHTDGIWLGFGDVKGQAGNKGAFTAVAAASVAGELQLIGVTSDGNIWHTIRHADGSWSGFGDVKGQAGNRGAFTAVAAAGIAGELQLIGVTSDGNIWHTIRHADGIWLGFGDVKGQAGNKGAFTAVAAASVAGELQLIGVTNDGNVWHTIRHADGSWVGFGDVKGQAGNKGTFTAVTAVGIAVELQLIGVTNDGNVWHTIRHADGSWVGFGDVKGQAGSKGTFTAVGAASTPPH